MLWVGDAPPADVRFSTLQRVEIAEIPGSRCRRSMPSRVSVLFNESKLLKSPERILNRLIPVRFSTLQRVEIAEIKGGAPDEVARRIGFSTLQRVEIAEIVLIV